MGNISRMTTWWWSTCLACTRPEVWPQSWGWEWWKPYLNVISYDCSHHVTEKSYSGWSSPQNYRFFKTAWVNLYKATLQRSQNEAWDYCEDRSARLSQWPRKEVGRLGSMTGLTGQWAAGPTAEPRKTAPERLPLWVALFIRGFTSLSTGDLSHLRSWCSVNTQNHRCKRGTLERKCTGNCGCNQIVIDTMKIVCFKLTTVQWRNTTCFVTLPP